MVNCKIIEDLLPSYCDGLTGDESNTAIDSHVENCPRCAQLLKKMSAEPPREILDHREQFRRKLKEYERKHKSKVLMWTVSCLIALLVLILLWSNSELIAQRGADIRMGGKGIKIASAIPVDEHKVENYYIYRANDGYHLVTLTKHTFWNIWYFAKDQAADSENVLSLSWFGESSWNRFVEGTEVDASSNFEVNHLYIGNNATELLQLDSSEIPGDVYVKINQVQSSYWIWVVSDNMDAINQLNILEKLQLDATN